MSAKHTAEEREARAVYERVLGVLLEFEDVKVLKETVKANFTGYGSAAHEVFTTRDEMEVMARVQAEQLKSQGFRYKRTPVTERWLCEGSAYLILEEVDMHIEENKHELHLRLSVLLEKIDGTWLVTYFHGSSPDSDIAEDEAFPMEGLRKKNRELEALIAERTRELQIEAAMERVRSRTMAMQNSDELIEVATTIYQELKQLGFDRVKSGGFIFPDEEKDIQTCWFAQTETPEMLQSFTIRNSGDAWLEERIAFRRKHRAGFLEQELHGDQVTRHMEVVWPDPEIDPERLSASNAMPDPTFFSMYFLEEGYMILISDAPLDPSQKGLMKRFAQSFNTAYSRVLELQKAEEQTRAAQLEAALERVRTQVTAMQESADLLDIVVNMRGEFVKLGHEAHYFWHMRWLPDIYEKAMTSGDGARIGNVMELPRHMHGDIPELASWEESDTPTTLYAMDAEAAIAYVDKMVELGDFKQVDPQAPSPDLIRQIGGLTFVMARTTHGEIGYSLPGQVADLPAEDLETLVRFAGVFDLAYRRFEDLKESERQKREAEIELALERVRAQTMAMHKSEDLAKVASTLFDQIRGLGGDLFSFGIVLCQLHEGAVEQWHSLGAGDMSTPFRVPIDLDYIHQYRYDQWKAGTNLFSIEIPEEYIREHFERMFELPSVRKAMAEAADGGVDIQIPEWEIDYGASFSDGYLLVSSLKPFEEKHIFPRFAKAFEQAYIRFKDLEKAEEQAREAEVELALERVRNRAMSMQKSDELSDLVATVLDELTKLDFSLTFCIINIINEPDGSNRVWAANPKEGKAPESYYMRFEDYPFHHAMMREWKAQTPKFVYVMEGEEKVVYDEYLYNETEFSRFPEEIKAANKAMDKYVASFVFSKFGGLQTVGDAPLSEESMDILYRFGKVFDQTYTRFLDLQLKEEQAIALNEEKQQLEKTLKDLRATQSQLVHAEKMASLGELTAGIAHEIQNPLNFVNNFSEVSRELIEELLDELKKGDTEEVDAIAQDVIQNLEKIVHHGKRADSIVKGMLQHSRSGDSKKEPTDLNKLADEYLRLAYHGLRAKDKSFNAGMETDFDPDLPVAEVIPRDIGRVMLNLVTNAFHAVSEKKKGVPDAYEPKVTVKTQRTPEGIEIQVADNGPGIPENVRDKIFQPFFTTKPTGEGTGLGLSMSFDIISKGHGGTLQMETVEGKGTKFTIKLPSHGH